MKRIYLIALVLAMSMATLAADFDILIKTNSEKIEALIQEVSDTEVKYKKVSNPDGPTYNIKMSELATIIYANGDVQAITQEQDQAQPAQNGSGFTFNYEGVEQAQKEKKERQKRAYEWENFFLLNYQFGRLNHHAVGFTYGRVKLAGWYISASIGIDPNFHYGYQYTGLEYNREINVNVSYTYPFYTGKISHNQVTFNAGAIIRMVIPIYWYCGLGGGYLTRTYELANGQWAMLAGNWQYKGMNLAFETGLQGNIKGFTISAGYYMLTDCSGDNMQHELKFGIGYTFPDKKKQPKQLEQK